MHRNIATVQREICMSTTFEGPRRGRDDAAAALLRITLGVMYLTHSIVLKAFTFGFAGTAAYFASLGLPGVTAYLVIGAEAIGGALLLANVATGWVAGGVSARVAEIGRASCGERV